MIEEEFGKPCGPGQKCTLHNIFCGYPKCWKGNKEHEEDMKELSRLKEEAHEYSEYMRLKKKFEDE